ncbi:putative neurogenic locus Notch protein-like, partial [Apostichopus japonicus]
INECSSFPCVNGGQCINGLNVYQCACQSGFTGTNCETDIQECASNPCQHGGICQDGRNNYQCDCQSGWQGFNCEIDINECNSSPCINGICNNLVDRFTCDCYPGWTGITCDSDFDECGSDPCQNGATCINGINNFDCECSPGWQGEICSIDINECSSMPCQNNGTCANLQTDLNVNASLDLKEFSVKETSMSVRAHLVFMVDFALMNQTTCSAARVNLAILAEIVKLGICQDEINGYNCVCQPGFTGTRCETNIDECESNPCQNQGNCINRPTVGYDCECFDGFQGTNCEIDLDECDSSPCMNGGICVDGPNQFTCICPQGWSGVLCETVIGCRVNISLPADQYLEIQSPNYPNFYQDNEDCRWIVRAPTGHTLSVSIVDFITEENYDVLSFGTGSNPADSGSKVLEMSGMMSETVEEFINLNHMWVTFRSDSDKVERGFSLEIRDVGFQ